MKSPKHAYRRPILGAVCGLFVGSLLGIGMDFAHDLMGGNGGISFLVIQLIVVTSIFATLGTIIGIACNK